MLYSLILIKNLCDIQSLTRVPADRIPKHVNHHATNKSLTKLSQPEKTAV